MLLFCLHGMIAWYIVYICEVEDMITVMEIQSMGYDT